MGHGALVVSKGRFQKEINPTQGGGGEREGGREGQEAATISAAYRLRRLRNAGVAWSEGRGLSSFRCESKSSSTRHIERATLLKLTQARQREQHPNVRRERARVGFFPASSAASIVQS